MLVGPPFAETIFERFKIEFDAGPGNCHRSDCWKRKKKTSDANYLNGLFMEFCKNFTGGQFTGGPNPNNAAAIAGMNPQPQQVSPVSANNIFGTTLFGAHFQPVPPSDQPNASIVPHPHQNALSQHFEGLNGAAGNATNADEDFFANAKIMFANTMMSPNGEVLLMSGMNQQMLPPPLPPLQQQVLPRMQQNIGHHSGANFFAEMLEIKKLTARINELKQQILMKLTATSDLNMLASSSSNAAINQQFAVPTNLPIPSPLAQSHHSQPPADFNQMGIPPLHRFGPALAQTFPTQLPVPNSAPSNPIGATAAAGHFFPQTFLPPSKQPRHGDLNMFSSASAAPLRPLAIGISQAALQRAQNILITDGSGETGQIGQPIHRGVVGGAPPNQMHQSGLSNLASSQQHLPTPAPRISISTGANNRRRIRTSVPPQQLMGQMEMPIKARGRPKKASSRIKFALIPTAGSSSANVIGTVSNGGGRKNDQTAAVATTAEAGGNIEQH